MTDYLLRLNPEPWTTSEASAGRKNGRTVVNFYKRAGLEAYQAAVREALEDYEIELIPLGTPIRLEFYFWRQVAAYTGSRESHRHRADATNLQKGLEDALQGVLFTNDQDVCSIRSVIVEQEPDTKPAILVRIDRGYPEADCLLASQLRSVLGHPSGQRGGFAKHLVRDVPDDLF